MPFLVFFFLVHSLLSVMGSEGKRCHWNIVLLAFQVTKLVKQFSMRIYSLLPENVFNILVRIVGKETLHRQLWERRLTVPL